MSEEANNTALNSPAQETGITDQQQTDSGSATQKQEHGDGITIAYNHEKIPLSRDEAARLAQIGKRFEGKEALLAQAEAEFKRSGLQSVDAFLEERRKALEKQQVESLVTSEGLSEKAAQELIRLRGLEQQIREREQKETEESRLVNEMHQLKEQYPDVDLNNLPDEVAAYSAKHGVPVMTAYENVVLLQQYRKELSDLKKAQENAESTAGSAHSSAPADGGDSFDALWAKGAR